MKKVLLSFCFLFVFLSALPLFAAGPQLIAHGQDIPTSLEDQNKSLALSTLVEALFDQLFEKGFVTFDVNLGKSGPWTADPTTEIQDLAVKNGADQTIYIHLYWKPLEEKSMVLDRLEYFVFKTSQKKPLIQGKLTNPALQWPSKDEEVQAKALAAQLIKALAAYL